MVDEKPEPMEEHEHETEYQYSEDQADYNYDAGDENEPPNSKWQQLLAEMQKHRKPLIIGVIAVVVLIIAYFVFMRPETKSVQKPSDFKSKQPGLPGKVVTTPKPPATPNPTPAPTDQKPQPIIAPMPVIEPIPTPAPAPQPVSPPPAVTPTGDDTKAMNALRADMQRRLATVEAQNQVLQNSVQSMNVRLTRIEILLNQLGHTADKPAHNDTHQTHTKPPVIQPSIKYTIEAIVPGRVWVKSEDGKIVTLTVGDRLSGYGQVEKINPDNDDVAVIFKQSGGQTIILPNRGSSQ